MKNVNPRGKIPVLVDGDFKLTEGPAIAKYLLHSRADAFPKNLWPEDVKKRSEIDVFLEWYANTYRPNLLGPMQYGVKTKMRGLPEDKDAEKFVFDNAWKVLGQLDKILEKKGSAYIVGEELSLADIFIFHETTDLLMGKFDEIPAEFPTLAKWFAKVLETKEVKEVYDQWWAALAPIKEKFKA